jgi:SAM-dependent methyltransferase
MPKTKVVGRESPESYSEAEYSSTKLTLGLYDRYIDLRESTVLDAGCGLGGRTVFYARQGCKRVVGLDIDENHIRYSNAFATKQQVPNVEFRLGGLDALPFEAGTFDVIFLNDVVEHIDRSLLLPVFTECKRVLKATGRICIDFPPWTSHHASHLYDYIHIPWCQLIFSTSTLVNVTRRLNPKPRFGKSSYVEHFLELNRITIEEFKQLIRDLNFRVINYEERMIRNVALFKYIPFAKKYLTSTVTAVLAKA